MPLEDDLALMRDDKFIGDSETAIQTIQLSSGARVVYIPPEQQGSFEELITRAMATWERAPISIREFADYFKDGELRINYKESEVYRRNAEYAQGHQSTKRTSS